MHESNTAGRAFRWSIVLNSGLTALQLVIGFAFGSLALIGDALHNLGDVVGLVLGWGADRLSRRPAGGRFTYGYGRSTQMASLISGLLIFGAGAVVVAEAIERLFRPVPLVAGPVAWAAAAGIAINSAPPSCLATIITTTSTSGQRCCICSPMRRCRWWCW
ncbi:MAG: cation diffusion facilitator family transporter [Cyanobium sp.]